MNGIAVKWSDDLIMIQPSKNTLIIVSEGSYIKKFELST